MTEPHSTGTRGTGIPALAEHHLPLNAQWRAGGRNSPWECAISASVAAGFAGQRMIEPPQNDWRISEERTLFQIIAFRAGPDGPDHQVQFAVAQRLNQFGPAPFRYRDGDIGKAGVERRDGIGQDTGTGQGHGTNGDAASLTPFQPVQFGETRFQFSTGEAEGTDRFSSGIGQHHAAPAPFDQRTFRGVGQILDRAVERGLGKASRRAGRSIAPGIGKHDQRAHLRHRHPR